MSEIWIGRCIAVTSFYRKKLGTETENDFSTILHVHETNERSENSILNFLK